MGTLFRLYLPGLVFAKRLCAGNLITGSVQKQNDSAVRSRKLLTHTRQVPVAFTQWGTTRLLAFLWMESRPAHTHESPASQIFLLRRRRRNLTNVSISVSFMFFFTPKLILIWYLYCMKHNLEQYLIFWALKDQPIKHFLWVYRLLETYIKLWF